MRQVSLICVLFVVCLMICTASSSMSAAWWETGPAPVAIAAGSTNKINWSPVLCVTVGETVYFKDDGSYDYDYQYDPLPRKDRIASWVWDFGDEGSATGKTVSHIFEAPGSYLVRLTVDDLPRFANDTPRQSDEEDSVIVYALPTSIAVTDEGDYTSSTSELSATWTHCGNLTYEYAIGTTAGGRDVRDWTYCEEPEVTASGLTLANEQTYYFSVRAKGYEGCVSQAGVSDGIIVDTDPPQGSVAIDDGQLFTDSRDVTLTLEATDSVSGVAGMRFTNEGGEWNSWEAYATSKPWILPEGDGLKTVYVQYRDTVLNESGAYSDTITLDATAPADFTPTANPSSWTNASSVQISFSTTDATSGINHYEVAVDSGTYATQTSPYSLDVSGLSDGTHAVYVKAIDNAGNQRTKDVTIYLDKADPADFTPTANPASWTNANSVQISFSTTDATSGINHYEVAVDSGTYATQTSPYSLDVSGLSDGTHAVYVKAIDNAGNQRTKDVTIYLDKGAPADFTPTADPSGWTNGSSVQIIFATTDSVSGINHYEVAVDAGSYSTQVSPYSLNVSGLSEGTHAVHVKAVDNAGNQLTKDTTVYLDRTAPADFTPTANPSSWTNASSIQISFSTTDSLSGINHYEVAVDAGAYTTQVSPYGLSTSGLTDGTHTVHVKSVDNAENQRIKDVTIYVDKSAPADFTLTADPPSSPSNWVNTDVKVSFSTSDTTAGMDHYEVSTDGTSYSSTGVVWPNIDFDDQLDSANKGTSSSVDYVNGYWGDAADFGTAGQYVRYAAANFPTQGTVGFWIMGSYDGSRGNNTVLDTVGTSTAANGDLRVMLTAGNLIQFQMYSGSWQSATSTSQISSTNWTHIAVSYGSSGLKVFVSGSQEGSTGSAVTRTTTDDVYVGDYQGDASSNAFNGSTDCIRVSDVQSDTNITATPTAYTMSYVMTQEEQQTVYVKAIDKGGNERIKDTQTYIDKTDPTFTISQVNPAIAKNDGNPVTIIFTSENLPTNPTVTVNAHSASYSSKSANGNSATYTYTYYVQGGDPDGDATIFFSGTDRAGNSNTGSNTTALDIYALQWSGSPSVDATGTVMLGWNYTHTFYKLDAEYSVNGGASWSTHNLFDVAQANQSDYRFWSMGTGTRKFRVRIYESPSSSFIAGVTSDVSVPGSATLPNYPYTDYLSADQRGRTYSPAY